MDDLAPRARADRVVEPAALFEAVADRFFAERLALDLAVAAADRLDAVAVRASFLALGRALAVAALEEDALGDDVEEDDDERLPCGRSPGPVRDDNRRRSSATRSNARSIFFRRDLLPMTSSSHRRSPPS